MTHYRKYVYYVRADGLGDNRIRYPLNFRFVCDKDIDEDMDYVLLELDKFIRFKGFENYRLLDVSMSSRYRHMT